MDFYDNEKEISGLVNYQVTRVLVVMLFNGELKGTAKGFSGIKTISVLRMKENQSFDIDFNVKAGKAKLVAIKKKEIIVLAENHFVGQLITHLPKGFCRIRLVGEDANVKIKLRRIS